MLAGNRPGRIPHGTASKFCDRIVGSISAGTLINQVDEVHTVSSLTGFEALLRSKDVYTYGGPFMPDGGLRPTGCFSLAGLEGLPSMNWLLQPLSFTRRIMTGRQKRSADLKRFSADCPLNMIRRSKADGTFTMAYQPADSDVF